MPFSRGLNCGPDPRQGPSGGLKIRIFHPHDFTKTLNFRWGRLRGSLSEANIYLGINSIWIRPYIYPLLSFSHYNESKQRLYVSATIGDPADLSRRLGVRPI